jgi:hypothetical protein
MCQGVGNGQWAFVGVFNGDLKAENVYVSDAYNENRVAATLGNFGCDVTDL